MFFLFNLIISLGLGLIDAITGTLNTETGYGLLSGIYSLAIIIPSFAVGARRLHDTDRSGWWQLLLLIPIIGAIVLLVFFCLDSTPGANRFGANPKENSQPTIQL